MSKRSPRPSVRRHVPIDEADWNLLMEMYGPESNNNIGPGRIIQELVHSRCNKLRVALANEGVPMNE